MRPVRAAYRPVPQGFPDAFVRLGWAGIEAHFHAHARSIKRWMDVCGRDELIAARAAYVAEQRKARRKARDAGGQP